LRNYLAQFPNYLTKFLENTPKLSSYWTLLPLKPILYRERRKTREKGLWQEVSGSGRLVSRISRISRSTSLAGLGVSKPGK
jgi:hypothetical protein